MELTPDFNNELVGYLNEVLQQVLQTRYDYSPGYNDSSPGRVQGSSIKNASGEFQRSYFQYNESLDTFDLIMPAYWRNIDEGRRPGAMKEVTRTSKTGKTYTVRIPEKMPPISAIIRWATLKGINLGKNNQGAFGIAYNIGKFGIKQTNFFDKIIDGFEEKLFEVAPDKIEELLVESIDKLFTKTFETL